MNMDTFKWLYTFAALFALVGWGLFAPEGGLILGALISLVTLTAQHWFRKAKPE